MKNVVVALPYAVSIRDFVSGGTLDALTANPDIRVTIFTLNPDLVELAGVRTRGIEILQLVPYQDNMLEAAVKRVYPQFFSDQFEYLRIVNAGNILRELLGWALSAVRRIIGPRRTLGLVGRVLQFLHQRRGIPDQISSDVDLFIGTRSLVNSVDYGLIAEASHRKIRMLTLASSWDNFTTKGYFPFPAERTVVWNEQMSQELISLFDVDPAQIVVAGYPRAGLLRERAGDMGSAAYLRSIGIDGYGRFVLYSASYGELTRAPGHSNPLEYEGILQICEALESALPPDVCLLIRLHPFSKESDQTLFAALNRSFVFVPGRPDKYVERVMGLADEEHFATQLAKAECVISLASTVSIDALCLHRPVVNVDFDVIPGVPAKWSSRRFYSFNHFRDLIKTVDLPLRQSPQAIVEFVTDCLNKKHIDAVNFEAFERMYVPKDSADYPQVVRKTVETMIGD